MASSTDSSSASHHHASPLAGSAFHSDTARASAQRTLSRRTLLTAAVAAALLAACGKGGEQGGFHGMPPAPVTFQPAAAREVAVEYEYVGQTAGSREVEIRARVNGIVEKRLYEEGTVVRAGQPLFRLDSASYAAAAAQAEAALASAEANMKQAEREFARMKPLIEAKAISQKEWDQATSGFDIGRAQQKEAQARLASARVDLGYTNIHAPISGVIGRALKVEGALANAVGGDSLLATMAQTDPMYVNFAVAEREKSDHDAEIAAGTLKLPKTGFVAKLKNSDGAWLQPVGKLGFSDYKADANTGAYSSRAEFANPNGALAPGQFVRVVLTGATRPDAIVVPQRAVLDGPMGKYVYIVGKDKDAKPVAEMRPIVPGEWVSLDGQERNGWIIRQGLKAGDPVIIDGTARIFFPGQPLQPMTPEEAAKAAQQPPGAPGAPQGKPADKPAEKTAEKPATPAKEAPAAKAAEKSADKPAAKK